MNYTTLYTAPDNKSYFKDESAPRDHLHPLGMYSKKIPVQHIMFRTFEKDAIYPWHNAPQPQYIVYLEGQVEVEASGGETRVFNPGDVLFAADLTGEGHVTKTLTKGRSMVITTQKS